VAVVLNYLFVVLVLLSRIDKLNLLRTLLNCNAQQVFWDYASQKVLTLEYIPGNILILLISSSD